MGEDPRYNGIDFDLDWLEDFDVSGSASTSERTEQPSLSVSEEQPVRRSRSASDETPVRRSYSAPEETPVRRSRSVSDETPARRSRSVPEETPARRSRSVPDKTPARRSRSVSDETPVRRSRSVSDETPAHRSRSVSRQDAGRRAAPSMADYEQARRGRGRGRSARPARRGKASTPLVIVAVVLAIGMLFAGWQLVSILLDYHRDSSAYDELADKATALLAEQDEESAPENTPKVSTETEEEVSEVPISVDWDYLASVNSEIIGWLYCPDTVINYPVVQTSDNSYYLYKNASREDAGSGALFADTSSVSGIVRSNLIVYGHNMKNDSMFGTLEEYKSQSYYDEHPVLYFLTPSASYRIDLIAAHIVESTLDNYPTYFEDEGEYGDYLNYITSRSFFSTDASVSTEYQLFTMSTCDYTSSYSDPRLLVQGMMVPIT